MFSGHCIGGNSCPDRTRREVRPKAPRSGLEGQTQFRKGQRWLDNPSRRPLCGLLGMTSLAALEAFPADDTPNLLISRKPGNIARPLSAQMRCLRTKRQSQKGGESQDFLPQKSEPLLIYGAPEIPQAAVSALNERAAPLQRPPLRFPV